eukprot:scaffold31870_cov37-Prasinocladus_malaysianus.AAC.2
MCNVTRHGRHTKHQPATGTFDANFLHGMRREKGADCGDYGALQTADDNRVAFTDDAVDEDDINGRAQALDDLCLGVICSGSWSQKEKKHSFCTQKAHGEIFGQCYKMGLKSLPSLPGPCTGPRRCMISDRPSSSETASQAAGEDPECPRLDTPNPLDSQQGRKMIKGM